MKFKHPKRLYVARVDSREPYTITGESLAEIAHELFDGQVVAIYELVDAKKFERKETLK